MDRLPLTSKDVLAEKIARIREEFPEVFSEGKIDFERLKMALGEFVDNGRERYGLSWAGKSEAIRNIQTPSVGTLLPVPEESVNFDTSENLIIEGDNLEVLKLLQKSYHGKIKMIYIDPPYNTGNEFIYPDNFREGLEDYLRYSGQVDGDGIKLTTNTETDGRFHSKWLNMMYPRLFLARNLLRDDGIIFVSIDDHEVRNLTTMMMEIFGEENFVGQFVVQLNPRGRHLDRFIARTHEYVVVFARDITQDAMYEFEKDERMASEYNKEDEIGGKYRELELRNRNPAFNRTTRPNLYYPFYVDPNTGNVSLSYDSIHTVEVFPKNSIGEDSCWTWGKDKAERERSLLVGRMVADGGWRIYRKDYLIKGDGQTATTMPKSVWIDKEINNDYGKKAIQELFGENVFDFPKSPDLLEKLVRLGSKPGDIVLDFFAGSGVTADAVLRINAAENSNRKFILVQLPEPTQNVQFKTIADITKERVRRLISKLNEEQSQGLLLEDVRCQDRGFRVFKLTSSNFKIWDASQASKNAGELAEQLRLFTDNVKPDRSQKDILWEIILKSGLPLTASIDTISAGGRTVYTIAGGALLICLEDDLTMDHIRSMINFGPHSVVCLDSAFHGNDNLKTNTKLLMESHGIEFHTV
ncbi:site-specific DNA-methyltransferase [Neobacillus fumarioli]|uniref:site-specific DNA-methyltransferase n=1 Tax=Neobacillus fumarioli TaxID=105229 RepID=UPI0008376345|nr:site-specific DNA-methyltransferase [Neobacillus fumarioli]